MAELFDLFSMPDKRLDYISAVGEDYKIPTDDHRQYLIDPRHSTLNSNQYSIDLEIR